MDYLIASFYNPHTYLAILFFGTLFLIFFIDPLVSWWKQVRRKPIVFAVDVSGSMQGLRKKVERAINQYPMVEDTDTVLLFDTDVISVITVRDFLLGESASPGFGGTYLNPVFEWMADNTDDALLVVITDGYLFDRVYEKHDGRVEAISVVLGGDTEMRKLDIFDRVSYLA